MIKIIIVIITFYIKIITYIETKIENIQETFSLMFMLLPNQYVPESYSNIPIKILYASDSNGNDITNKVTLYFNIKWKASEKLYREDNKSDFIGEVNMNTFPKKIATKINVLYMEKKSFRFTKADKQELNEQELNEQELNNRELDKINNDDVFHIMNIDLNTKMFSRRSYSHSPKEWNRLLFGTLKI